jgi:hypothetical protein
MGGFIAFISFPSVHRLASAPPPRRVLYGRSLGHVRCLTFLVAEKRALPTSSANVHSLSSPRISDRVTSEPPSSFSYAISRSRTDARSIGFFSFLETEPAANAREGTIATTRAAGERASQVAALARRIVLRARDIVEGIGGAGNVVFGRET